MSAIQGGGGAGGSIIIFSKTLAGIGSISAIGGSGTVFGGGGAGGRIAVFYESNEFTGTIFAYGGKGPAPGGAGTIYKKSHITGLSSLSVDNNGNIPNIQTINPFNSSIGVSWITEALDVHNLDELNIHGKAILAMKGEVSSFESFFYLVFFDL